ncbi:LysR family transcriptional regulator [Sulfitobacter sp. MF3-043]|uniref:LysR family transcriptional regulator n=1 Tax=Sulfitobacter sediminivivens TaxID=3252902 RepID=UPI003EB955CD
MRRIPPLNSIKAFDAVSRNGNISKAAAELSVSASAVSQQIATLEDWMGGPLFFAQRKHIRTYERRTPVCPRPIQNIEWTGAGCRQGPPGSR